MESGFDGIQTRQTLINAKILEAKRFGFSRVLSQFRNSAVLLKVRGAP